MGQCSSRSSISKRKERKSLFELGETFIETNNIENFAIFLFLPKELIRVYLSFLDISSLDNLRIFDKLLNTELDFVIESIFKSLKNKYFNHKFLTNETKYIKPMNEMIYDMCNNDYHEILISGGMIFENNDSVGESTTKCFKMKIFKRDFTITFEDYVPLQMARRDHSTIYKDGIIYIISTGLDLITNGHVECLDILSKRQFVIKKLPLNLIWTSAIVFENKIWVIGGLEFNSWVDKHSSNNIYIYDEENNNWVEHPTRLIKDRSASSLCIFNDKIYICGGIMNLQTQISSIEIFDPKTGSIEEFGNISKIGCNFYNFVYENNFYTLNKKNPITIEKMNIIYGNWELVSELILEEDKCRDNLTSIFVEDKIFILGGYGDEKTFDYYDFKTNTWASKDELCINHREEKRIIPYKMDCSSAVLLGNSCRKTWDF